MADAKTTITQLLSLADIKIDGDRPFDIQVHNQRLYGQILGNPELGLGESYMDGWWDVEQLPACGKIILGKPSVQDTPQPEPHKNNCRVYAL